MHLKNFGALVVLGFVGLMLVATVRGAETAPTPEETFKVGVAAFQAGNYDEAMNKFETLLGTGLEGESLEVTLFTLAATCVNKKDPTKAEEYYNRYLKEFPEGKYKIKSLLALSQILTQSGRKAEADKALEQVCRGKDELAGSARLMRASGLVEMGKFPEAAEVLRPLIAGGLKDSLSAKAGIGAGGGDDETGAV